jgi:hypothetical protein
MAIGNRPYKTELIVSLIRGWIIEIRSTYPAAFTPGDPPSGSISPQPDRLGDHCRRFAKSAK